MRLDKYLKVSRLIKRRTVANEACDLGRITVNGITRTRLPYTLVYGRSFFQEVPLCLTIPFPPLPPTASSSTGASA